MEASATGEVPASVGASPPTVLVDVQHVSYQYPTASRPALEDVSLRVHAGDRILVIGHNGSGKSTLLSLLAGRRKPQPHHHTNNSRSDGTTSGSRAAPSIRVMGADPFDDTSMAQHVALIGAPWPTEAFFGNTVDRVASPAPIPERKTSIASALHLRLSRFVDKMSAGEKRRVQILHGMLYPATVFLLDECSTDIDVAERKTALELVRRECEERGGCCLYATHILDRIHDWATHLLLMRDARVVAFLSVKELNDRQHESAHHHLSLESFALQFMATGCVNVSSPAQAIELDGLSSQEGLADVGHAASSPIRFNAQAFLERGTRQRVNTTCDSEQTVPEKVYFTCDEDRAHPQQCTDVVIECTGLSFRDVFINASFKVFRGERVLLCGCNGAGKSTLLNMLGGKQFFNNTNGALKVLGKTCYDDMTLNGLIAYGGDWWTHVPGGEVHVREMLTIASPRAERLRALLAVDLDWDVRHISSGEQKRVQILFYLLEDKPVVLLDEATADLDVDQRHALLSFLFAESVCRGVTVVYATHIFGGLSGWADTVIILDRTVRGVHAVWRQREGDVVDLDRVSDELVALKAREAF